MLFDFMCDNEECAYVEQDVTVDPRDPTSLLAVCPKCGTHMVKLPGGGGFYRWKKNDKPAT
jgi:hypothetical protein